MNNFEIPKEILELSAKHHLSEEQLQKLIELISPEERQEFIKGVASDIQKMWEEIANKFVCKNDNKDTKVLKAIQKSHEQHTKMMELLAKYDAKNGSDKI